MLFSNESGDVSREKTISPFFSFLKINVLTSTSGGSYALSKNPLRMASAPACNRFKPKAEKLEAVLA
jgi:hypothetical protein